MQSYDITFLGHMCYDEITPFRGPKHIAPGSAVLCGAVAAARAGAKVAVITKLAEKDRPILKALEDERIDVTVIPAEETTYSRVIYISENHDLRRLVLEKSAGLITIEQVPEIQSRYLHLAAISDQEFDLPLMRHLKSRGHTLTVDMQSFVRQVDSVTHEIAFKDVAEKREIFKLVDMVKLDGVEARALTGLDNLEEVARTLASWGAKEMVITQAAGVSAWAGGRRWSEGFSNQSDVGRTGRGDTAFAAYLAYRLEHDIPTALKFAAALVSIKMETPGPFRGTLADVLARMDRYHRGGPRGPIP
jgi:sugar/nucleoside kinase (ribokinase family)